MIRDLTLWLGTLALLTASTGCPTADDDDGGGARIDLEGVVIDRNLGDAPVADAWILLDTGDELITARSDGDGSFLIPEVPAGTPVTLTVAGEERRATTYLDRVLADEELPLELGCEYREASYYDLPMIVVSGTFTGAPQGSYVIFSGEGVLNYDYFYVESATTEFQFEAQVATDADEYFFTALAFDGGTGEALAAAAVTVDVAAEVDVDVELDHHDTTWMTISASQPLLDGEPLTTLDPTYTSSLGMVYSGDGPGGFTGWTMDWEATASGFDLDVTYVPIDDEDAHITLYLAEDLTAGGAFSYAILPFEPGATELDVQMMDSPLLDGGGDFVPGTTVTWDPVEGATDYTIYVLDGDSLAWWFLADGPSFSFPRMPDGFDSSIILDGTASWVARAYERTEDDEGGTDLDQPYRVAETPDGDIFFE